MTTDTTTTSSVTGTEADAPLTRVELTLGGMTCVSCAARIEKKLNCRDGVEASANFATETATVHYDAAAVTPDQLVATVEATGYTATLPAPDRTDIGTPAADRDETTQRTVVVGAVEGAK